MEQCVCLLATDTEINPLIRLEPSETYHFLKTHQLAAMPSGAGLGNSDSNHNGYAEKYIINIRKHNISFGYIIV